MKFLQIGLGSMGKRRIRNLQYLGFTDIIGFDTSSERKKEATQLYGIKILDDYKLLDWNSITHVIISTSPDKHMQYAIDAAKNEKHVFIEASVIDTNMEILIEESINNKTVIAPSCTMRFDPIVQKTKEIIESKILGRILYVNHHFGQYLPYWHPYEKITDFYVSQRNTGAAREIIPFDLVYLSWLFGNPKYLTSMITNTETLGVDIDDIYSLLIRTEKNTQINMTIDVVSKVSYRQTKVIAENGNIEIDNVKGTLSVFNAESNLWQLYTRDDFSKTHSTEEMYVNEMKSFLDATENKGPFPYTIEEDHQILKHLYSAEKAAQTATIIKVGHDD